jgi:hypothetical protein
MDMGDIAPVLLIVCVVAWGFIALLAHIVRRVIRLMKGGDPETKLDYLLAALFLGSVL